MLRRALLILVLVAMTAVVGAVLLLLQGDPRAEPVASAAAVGDRSDEAASSSARAERHRVDGESAESGTDEGREPVPAPTEEDHDAGGLIVRVTGPDGAPVPHARVLVSGWGARSGGTRTTPRALASGRTDDAGTSRLVPDLPATFVVLARDATCAGWSCGTAQPSPHPRTIDVQVQPSLRVGGVVRDQFGEPVPGVRVRAAFRAKRLTPYVYLEVATSGADGRYRFGPVPDDLRSGVVELSTSDTDATMSASRTIERATEDTDWSVRAIRTAPFSARITMPDGSAAEGAQLRVRLAEGSGAAVLTADDEGSVVGRVPIGRVVVHASGQRGDETLRRRHEREVVVPEAGVALGTVILDGLVADAIRERHERERRGR